MSNLTIEDLEELGRNRWLTGVIAETAARDGARFVELLHAMPISRESLSRTIEAALAAGWIVRNPGYGHPLRPEYILSARGRRAASACGRITRCRDALALTPASLKRWSLPIISVIGDGASRFADIERRLPRSSPRALSQGLKSLVGHDLVRRTVIDLYPPLPDYRLSERGTRLAAVL